MTAKFGEWQTIGSAPKDGTQILVWDGHDMSCVGFFVRTDGSGFWELAHGVDGSKNFLLRVITHWTPLPPPPAEQSDTELAGAGGMK